MNYRFSKPEKLTHLQAIKQLFEKGKSYNAFPLKLFYLKSELTEKVPFKILISVPKRNLKLAVKRNKAKRQLRETYRLNKNIITNLPLNNNTYLIAFMYTAKTNLPFKQLNLKTIELLNYLKKQLLKDAGQNSDSIN
jgi:ribonuclease P protein component